MRVANEIVKVAVGVAVILASTSSWAALESLGPSSVTRLLNDSAQMGTCAAKLDPGPQTTSIDCAPDWVTFSCSGDFNSKSEGTTKFGAAQLAFVTGKKLRVYLDDTKKHNGYCWSRVADVYQ